MKNLYNYFGVPKESVDIVGPVKKEGSQGKGPEGL